jgi:RsiW-degrading membrane proteinase PrsW (M82 family)
MMSAADLAPLVLAAVLVLAVTWWVWRTEVHRRERSLEIVGTLALGGVAGVVSRGILLMAFSAFPGTGEAGSGLAFLFLAGIITIVLVEEGSKSAALFLIRKRYDEIENGVVYGVAVGCGFALSGLIFSPIVSGDQLLSAGPLSGILLVVPVIALVQTTTGGLLGLAIALAASPGVRKKRSVPMYLVFAAIVLHAAILGLAAGWIMTPPESLLTYLVLTAVLACGIFSLFTLRWLASRLRLYDIGGMMKERALR